MLDPVRRILISLAQQAKEAQLRWHADRAAVRARNEAPTSLVTFDRHVMAEHLLLAALRAAETPTDFRIDGMTLPRDPVAAMHQLRDHVYGYQPDNRIEAENEAARVAYKQAAAKPVTAQEQRQAELLAELAAARRDKVVELAESLARHRPPS